MHDRGKPSGEPDARCRPPFAVQAFAADAPARGCSWRHRQEDHTQQQNPQTCQENSCGTQLRTQLNASLTPAWKRSTTQTVLKTWQVEQLQGSDEVIDIPPSWRRSRSQWCNRCRRLSDIPQLQFVERVIDGRVVQMVLSVIMQRQVPTIQKIKKTVETHQYSSWTRLWTRKPNKKQTVLQRHPST